MQRFEAQSTTDSHEPQVGQHDNAQHDNARVYGAPAAGNSLEATNQVHSLQLDEGRQEQRKMKAAMRTISFDISENGQIGRAHV